MTIPTSLQRKVALLVFATKKKETWSLTTDIPTTMSLFYSLFLGQETGLSCTNDIALHPVKQTIFQIT